MAARQPTDGENRVMGGARSGRWQGHTYSGRADPDLVGLEAELAALAAGRSPARGRLVATEIGAISKADVVASNCTPSFPPFPQKTGVFCLFFLLETMGKGRRLVLFFLFSRQRGERASTNKQGTYRIPGPRAGTSSEKTVRMRSSQPEDFCGAVAFVIAGKNRTKKQQRTRQTGFDSSPIDQQVRKKPSLAVSSSPSS